MTNIKQISFRLDAETYKKIKEKKEKVPSSMSMKAYILRCIFDNNPVQIQYNYDAIRTHTNEIMEIKDRLYPVIAMLTATDQALPKDIQAIISCLDALVESEKKLLDDNQKERNRLRKQIEKELKSRHDL